MFRKLFHFLKIHDWDCISFYIDSAGNRPVKYIRKYRCNICKKTKLEEI